MSDTFKYIIQAIITIIIVLIGLIIIKHNQPPKMVKIDLVAVTTHYTQLMAKETIGNNNLTTNNGNTSGNSKVKKISDTIKTNLEPIISSYAKNYNVIVIQAQALVGGNVPDITDIVIQQLDKKLR
jgi:hypothetical protein